MASRVRSSRGAGRSTGAACPRFDSDSSFGRLRTFTGLVFLAGASDRIFLEFGVPCEGQIVALRIALIVAPALVFWLVKRACCEELRRTGAHPLRGFPGRVVRRTPSGGYEAEP